jgi:hypothetical protein
MATKAKTPLVRISASDFSTVEEVFKAAALLITPDGQTQHQAFLQLMPHLYVLRNKGCSFLQLTDLLTKCNFTLQPSTVQSYYNAALAERMDICQQRMNEQIMLLAEVRKETKNVDVASVRDRVASISQNKVDSAAPKVDSIFGAVRTSSGNRQDPQVVDMVEDAQPVLPAPVSAPVSPPTTKPSSENKKTWLRPDPENHILVPNINQLPVDEHTNTPIATPPSIKEQPSSSNIPEHDGSIKIWKCGPLQIGVVPIKKRQNVDEAVYSPGDMEHPMIPGLMLTLEERLYGANLELINDNGEIVLETPDQKRYRAMWRKPIPMVRSSTDGNFTEMNASLFKPR